MVEKDHSSTVAFMREIFAFLGSSESTYNLLSSIHQSLKAVIYAENFFVVLLSTTKRYVTFPYYRDIKDSISSEELNLVPLEKIFQTLTFYAIKKKKIVCLTRSDIKQLITSKDVNVIGTLPEQWLCFPLIHQENFLGNFIIQSYRSSEEYNQHDIDVLTLISNVIATALFLFNQNAELNDTVTELNEYKEQLEIKIQERTSELENTLSSLQNEMSKSKELQQQLSFLAFHDSLTGLYNRKYFIDQVEILASKSNRESVTVTLAFSDLDGFKTINDTHGHACGDHVLKVTAERLKSSFRHHDIIARFGGDEFVVLISSEISISHLQKLLNRIVNLVSTPIEYQDDIVVSVGISIGVASNNANKIVVHELLDRADKALYQAKENGKGCFVVDG
jgi:diguanylate cyclase